MGHVDLSVVAAVGAPLCSGWPEARHCMGRCPIDPGSESGCIGKCPIVSGSGWIWGFVGALVTMGQPDCAKKVRGGGGRLRAKRIQEQRKNDLNLARRPSFFCSKDVRPEGSLY